MPLQPPQVLDPIFGTLISFADWVQLLNFVLQTTGYCTAFQQGQQNALPLIQPLALTADGATMNLTFGGTNVTPQFVLLDGLLCASVAQQTIVVAANSSGSTRTDKIWINTTLTQVGTVPREVEDTMGNKTPNVAIPVVISGLQNAWYDQGGTNPPVGTGWVVFAQVAVPNGATAITNGEITIELPNMNPSGAAGSNAYSTTVGGVVIPAVSSNVAVTVVNPTPFPIGDYVIISDGTHAMVGLVVAVAGAVLTVQNVVETLGSVGNTISSGAVIAPSGVPGPAGGSGSPGTPGAPGAAGHGATTTTAGAATPTIGSSVALAVADGTAFPNGTYGIVSDGTHAFLFIVTSGGTTNAITVQCLDIILGSAGNTVASGATVTFSGNAFPIGASLVSKAIIPGSAGSPVTATLSVVLPPGTFTVTVEYTGWFSGTTNVPNVSFSGAFASLGQQFVLNGSHAGVNSTVGGATQITGVSGNSTETTTGTFAGGAQDISGGIVTMTATRTA